MVLTVFVLFRRCDALDQYCVPGAERARGEGFAMQDFARPWLQVHIPVVLALAPDAARVLDAFVVDDDGAAAAHAALVAHAESARAEL